MIKPNEKYEFDRRSLNFDYVRNSPAETSTINTAISQKSSNTPREKSFLSLIISYHVLNLEVIKKADNSRYAISNDIRLVGLDRLLYSISLE